MCATVTVNVCREAYPPVERGADESVELSAHPTPNPPETNPSYRDEPPPHYSSLAFPSSTADPLLHASLSFSRPFFAPRCARNPCAPEQRVEGKMGKTRVGEIQCEFLLVDIYESLIILL